MSPLKWSLLALITLLSFEFCSANRARPFSEWINPKHPDSTRTALSPPRPPSLVVRPGLAQVPRPVPIDLADDGPLPSPVQGPSPAQSHTTGSIMIPSRPAIDGSGSYHPASKVPLPLKAPETDVPVTPIPPSAGDERKP